MNTFELKIWDDEREACTFYTVQAEDSTENETDKFFGKYGNKGATRQAAQELLSYILYGIGDDHGAHDAFFNRYEHEVSGLPHTGKVKLAAINYHFPNFPLRLYALKITEGIVVLFNGGVKDGPTNQTSSLMPQWREACSYARRITAAIESSEIQVNETKRILTNHLGGSEIII